MMSELNGFVATYAAIVLAVITFDNIRDGYLIGFSGGNAILQVSNHVAVVI